VLLGPVIGLSLFAAMFVASMLGVLIPMIFERIRIDPALSTGLLVISLIDITSMLVYFLLGSRFLI